MSKARDLANAGTALTTVSATELGYLDGVTSAVQTQIDSKEATLPSQTGNSGKYLTTDGTDKSWGTVATGATHNIVSFTSSQTWTVPTSAKYVDVLVVGGGTGGRGGQRSTSNNVDGGYGGGVTILNNIFLNGTGTVSVVVGAGSSGSAGLATTGSPTNPSDGGYSGFGTYCYSQGGRMSISTGGLPSYKGTSGSLGMNSVTQSDCAPLLTFPGTFTSGISGSAQGSWMWGVSGQATGYRGGYPGAQGTGSSNANTIGSHPGQGDPTQSNNNIRTNTLPSLDFYNLVSAPLVGAASAGTSGAGGGAGGAAGVVGIGGGGGTCTPIAGQPGGQGGAGAGGGGSWPNPVGGNGGNGGNAGTNTGAGGGAGAATGSTSAGTGGNGGNGAAGIVVVHWIS